MDMRSFNLNYENDILLHDEAVTKAVLVRQFDYIELTDRYLWRQYRNGLCRSAYGIT